MWELIKGIEKKWGCLDFSVLGIQLSPLLSKKLGFKSKQAVPLLLQSKGQDLTHHPPENQIKIQKYQYTIFQEKQQSTLVSMPRIIQRRDIRQRGTRRYIVRTTFLFLFFSFLFPQTKKRKEKEIASTENQRVIEMRIFPTPFHLPSGCNGKSSRVLSPSSLQCLLSSSKHSGIQVLHFLFFGLSSSLSSCPQNNFHFHVIKNNIDKIKKKLSKNLIYLGWALQFRSCWSR